MIHLHLAHLVTDGIGHVVTHDLVADVVDRIAARLRGGVGVTLLHAFLHLVAGIAATDRTGHGGNLLAGTTTNLVTQQATGDGTDHRTGDLVLILDRRLARHGDILADLARRLYLLLDRLHVGDLGVFRPFVHQAVGRHSTSGGYTDSTQNRTHQH